MPCDYSKYSPNWPAIREHILERANHRCERCGVPQYSVGYRDERGHWRKARGNGPQDYAGDGLEWPGCTHLTYAQASEIAEINNGCCTQKRGCDDDGNHWMVIVLTVAHLDHDVENNADSNLAALCQRCHNRHDVQYRKRNAEATRGRKRLESDMQGGQTVIGEVMR